MKKIAVFLFIIVIALCTFTACTDTDNKSELQIKLEGYEFELDGKEVSEDFLLPNELFGYSVSWMSGNDAIGITETEGGFLAKVTKPDFGENQIIVTLTLKVESLFKDFTVKVKPCTELESNLSNYEFELDGKEVTEDFSLPNKLFDHSATWTSNNDAIKITESEEGLLAVVTRPDCSENQVTVKLTVKVEEMVKDFTVIVKPFTELESSLNDYEFELDGKEVSEDFTLPNELFGHSATWTSDNDAVKITETDEGLLAVVTRPDSGESETSVNLTVTVEELSKEFMVMVKPYNVNDKYYDSITKELKLTKDFEGKNFLADGIGEATLVSLTEGDNTRFTLNDGEDVVVRYYCIDTPELIGDVEKWGKAASLFVKERLSKATQIVLESSTGSVPVHDSYGTRYLGYVWYKTAYYNEFKLLNLEIIENGFSESFAMNTDKYPYYSYMDEANDFAKMKKLRIYSTADDPLYSDDPIPMTIKEFWDNPEKFYNLETGSGSKVVFDAYLMDLVVSSSGTYTFMAGEYDNETGEVYKLNIYTAYISNPASKMEIGHLYTIIGSVQKYNGVFRISGIIYNELLQQDAPNGSFVLQKDYYLTFDSTVEYIDNYSETLYSDVTVVSSEVKDGVLTIVGKANKREKEYLGVEKQFIFTVDVPENYVNNLTEGSKFSVRGYQFEVNSGKIVIPNLLDSQAQETLKNYIFEKDGTVVAEDFILPSKIGGKDVEWISNKSEVTLERRSDDYLAKINLPEFGVVEVKLTVTLGKQSKDFTVSVKALDVYDFMDNYTFIKGKGFVIADFDLDKTVEYKGKTANITWSVDVDSENYIEINQEGNMCLVTPQSKPTPVQIKATFEYKGDRASKSYSMTVYREMTGMEMVDYWYTNTGVSADFSGYVVLIGTAYSPKYKNVSLYMVNDDFTAGYYLFRVNTDDENAALLHQGVHITITGTTNTDYNGLIETNAGGNLVVDTDVPEININEHVFAIDELVIGNLPATVYHESRLVSLTNWKVKSVCKAVDVEEGKRFTVMTITKGGVDVDIHISKYLEGAYKTIADDPTWKALAGLREIYSVGSTVNVTGILSKYGDKWEIMPLSTDDVAVGSTPDPDDKNDYAGNKVATAIDAVNAAIKSEGLDVSITAQKEATLPTVNGDVEISYTICGNSKVIVIDGGKLTITPDKQQNTHIMVTYKIGDFETISFFYIESLTPTAATMLEELVVVEKIDKVTDLPTIEGQIINWSVKQGADSLSISNNQMIPTLTENDVPTIITAELTYNGKTRTRDFIVVVKSSKCAVDANIKLKCHS